jgi:hypothetical protein
VHPAHKSVHERIPLDGKECTRRQLKTGAAEIAGPIRRIGTRYGDFQNLWDGIRDLNLVSEKCTVRFPGRKLK